MNLKVKLLIGFCIVTVLSGCTDNTVYDKYQAVDKEGWSLDQDLRFSVDIDDTITPYDFYVDIRNTRDYAYSNLFLFITTTFPDKVERRDTLECPLADLYGKWYGRQSSRHVDGRYLLHNHVIFPIKGTYTFQVSHAMRDTVLCGIKDVGLHVEKANNSAQ